ncbi:NnrU family protein [Consotaella aegiceratis]|uniref:NnrU family protein n=1 Tax=Consotaella aegiceratis TaxID=3097961 RepID=UPI002F42D3E5
MLMLVAGLILFLAVHSTRIVAERARNRVMRRLGEAPYKAIYGLLSLIGLLLIIFGYGDARLEATQLWVPPAGTRHLALLLVPIAFILASAAYAPVGRIKATVVHPLVLSVVLWSLGHLLANGTSADLLLFGGFLVWSVADYVASLARSRRMGSYPTAQGMRGDVAALVIGIVFAALFLGGLHVWLFGVSPLA